VSFLFRFFFSGTSSFSLSFSLSLLFLLLFLSSSPSLFSLPLTESEASTSDQCGAVGTREGTWPSAAAA